MQRNFLLPLALAVAVSLPAGASAATAHAKHPVRPVVRHWHGYGFLPGYRPPEQIEREDAYLFWRRHPSYYWYGWPGWYRGRWNGGGFGPCWTPTPIGPMWNCGR